MLITGLPSSHGEDRIRENQHPWGWYPADTHEEFMVPTTDARTTNDTLLEVERTTARSPRLYEESTVQTGKKEEDSPIVNLTTFSGDYVETTATKDKAKGVPRAAPIRQPTSPYSRAWTKFLQLILVPSICHIHQLAFDSQ